MLLVLIKSASLRCCIWRDLVILSLRVSFFYVLFVVNGNLFNFYFNGLTYQYISSSVITDNDQSKNQIRKVLLRVCFKMADETNLNCLLQIEQERSEDESSVGDSLALAFRWARFCSASLIRWMFSYVCSICACLVLSVASSSWCLGRGNVILALPGLFSYLLWRFPFCLNRWLTVASLNSSELASFFHIMCNNCQFLCNWKTSCFVDLYRYVIWSWGLARW